MFEPPKRFYLLPSAFCMIKGAQSYVHGFSRTSFQRRDLVKHLRQVLLLKSTTYNARLTLYLFRFFTHRKFAQPNGAWMLRSKAQKEYGVSQFSISWDK
jgi:uncharacterized protein (DUF2235 family)